MPLIENSTHKIIQKTPPQSVYVITFKFWNWELSQSKYPVLQYWELWNKNALNHVYFDRYIWIVCLFVYLFAFWIKSKHLSNVFSRSLVKHNTFSLLYGFARRQLDPAKLITRQNHFKNVQDNNPTLIIKR